MDSKLKSAFEEAISSKKAPAVGGVVLNASGDVLFKGAFGSTDILDSSAPAFTSTTPLLLWSCTKLVACVAALQLMEQGKLQLDDPAEKYVPDIANIQMLDGFTEQGEPNLRAPKQKPTILNLMTHTGGFSYDFLDKDTLQYRMSRKENPSEYVGVGAEANFKTPLIFEPGARYAYGINIDWLGFVVEAISGLPLNEYIDKNILKPLGMHDTVAHFKEGGPAPLLVHLKDEGGKLTSNADLKVADKPWRYGGGHYLISTLDDYPIFLLALLNDGKHPQSGAKILEPNTVKEYLFTDHLSKICSNEGVGEMKAVIAPLSNNGELLPGVSKGWSCGMMMSLEDSPKGRHAGSGAWAGLGNNYFWIDPKGGKLGFIVSSILPFMDRDILHLFDQMEKAAYGHDLASRGGNSDANFVVY